MLKRVQSIMGVLCLIASIFGCSAYSEDNQSVYEEFDGFPDVVDYNSEIYALDKFSVASLESSDPQYLDTPPKLNSWGITTKGGSRTQIALKLHTRKPRVIFNDPSIWSFCIRTSKNPIGRKYYNELNVNLFYKYKERRDLCCINTEPFEKFDSAEASYIPVGGYVQFESERKGVFTLDFQRETYVHSHETEGPIINVRGCWNIAGESGISGCSL